MRFFFPVWSRADLRPFYESYWNRFVLSIIRSFKQNKTVFNSTKISKKRGKKGSSEGNEGKSKRLVANVPGNTKPYIQKTCTKLFELCLKLETPLLSIGYGHRRRYPWLKIEIFATFYKLPWKSQKLVGSLTMLAWDCLGQASDVYW